MTADILTIDLTDLLAHRDMDRLGACVTQDGVFYLSGITALETVHQRAMSAVAEFFAPGKTELRKRYTGENPKIRRGFSSLESESTASITNAGDFTDYSMAFSMGLGDNIFPSKEFERVWQTYFKTFYDTSRSLSECVLASVRQTQQTERLLASDFDPVLRHRYYPDVPEDRCAENLPLRMASHYDISLTTMIIQSPCENGFVSLQCEVGGRYVDLPANNGCAVVLCGAVAGLLTNGAVRAPLHRVAAPPRDARVGSARTSSVFFLRPSLDFTFSIPLAKKCGLDIGMEGEVATFQEWMEGNYLNLRTARETSRPLP